MIRRRDNMPDSMDDLPHLVNSLAYSAFVFAHHYSASEADEIASELVDVCRKHGLYDGRFSNGE